MNQESIGFLEVAVKTANGALPIEGARVSIYEYLPSSEGTSGALLYSILTDGDGHTPRLALEAKSKELSMTPGNDSPFSVYNVSVEREGYYSNQYINVPIFQGITAIQPVELIPLFEYGASDDDYPSTSRRFVETPNTSL